MKRSVLALALAAAALLAGCGADPAPPAAALSVTSAATPTPKAAKLAAVADPARIQIPAIGVDAKLVKLGLEPSGAMEVPDFGLAGWYGEGPKPGAVGPAVIAAHVDGKSRPDVFYKLNKLKAGARIVVTDKAGKVHAFVVETSESTAKTALPAKKIWGATKVPTLRLITCGGVFDKRTQHYLRNTIVYATAA